MANLVNFAPVRYNIIVISTKIEKQATSFRYMIHFIDTSQFFKLDLWSLGAGFFSQIVEPGRLMCNKKHRLIALKRLYQKLRCRLIVVSKLLHPNAICILYNLEKIIQWFFKGFSQRNFRVHVLQEIQI